MTALSRSTVEPAPLALMLPALLILSSSRIVPPKRRYHRVGMIVRAARECDFGARPGCLNGVLVIEATGDRIAVFAWA